VSNPSTKTKRPAGFTRRAAAIFGAAIAFANSGAARIERFQFAPGAYEARLAVIEKIEAARDRGHQADLSFREFVSLVHPRYRWFKHCEVLGDVLQRVADGDISRLMIFMPPRHGKSEETSRLFTAYFLHRNPHKWVGLASYAADLAYTLSRASKDFFLAAGGELRGDAKAVKHWQTSGGGGMWAGGVGGPCTGKGWHLGIIDDPLKNAEQAASPKIREKQKEWFQSTFSTREEPEGGALIFILTRWNEDDLAGWQLNVEAGCEEDERQNWHIVNFPAIAEGMPAEEREKFPAHCVMEPDWRKPGEALCPERYTVAKLKKIASQVGAYFWNALYQQRPRPREGGFFKREWLTKFFDHFPHGSRLVRYWDKAGSEGKGDYSVGVLMAYDGAGRFYVVDVVRGQWSARQREDIILATAEADVAAYGDNYQIWLEQEPGSGGKESAQSSINNLAGFAVFAEPVTGKKETRATPFSAQCEAGNVYLKRGAAWLQKFIEELLGFPNAKNDDQVDGCSGAFNKLAIGWVEEQYVTIDFSRHRGRF
jgi:predicted phage terminase large subunit-like protein